MSAPSVAAYRLADAVADMALRYGESERRFGSAVDRDEVRRHNRAACRRLKALRRLTAALRDRGGAS